MITPLALFERYDPNKVSECKYWAITTCKKFYIGQQSQLSWSLKLPLKPILGDMLDFGLQTQKSLHGHVGGDRT